MIPAAYWFFLLLGLLLIGSGILLLYHGPQNLAAGMIAEIIALGCLFSGAVSLVIQVVIWLFSLTRLGD